MNATVATTSPMAPMDGMEHAEDTISAPPLVDRRVLSQFCQAVQQCADARGAHDAAADKLLDLCARIENLRSVAALCRLAILGHPLSFPRLKDELHCIAVDFPDDPIEPSDSEISDEDEIDNRFQFAAVIDLLAGASFVEKDDTQLRDRLIVGIIRAVEDAICYPLAVSREAATYLGIDDASVSMLHASAAIENITRRLIESDYKCDPALPFDIQARLSRLAHRWMLANPVTEMFRAITGPMLERIVERIDPDDASPGDVVVLHLRDDCARDQQSGDDVRKGSNAFVLFSPMECGKIVSWTRDSVQVQIPDRARTGPVAIVRKPYLPDIMYLLKRYECQYPQEWPYCIFSCIPMWKWAYPVAFGPPMIEISSTPLSVVINVFTKDGPLDPQTPVPAGEPVYVYYKVDPAGSETNTRLEVNAAFGQVMEARPGLVVYRPSRAGFIDLTWGSLQQSIPVAVIRASVNKTVEPGTRGARDE